MLTRFTELLRIVSVLLIVWGANLLIEWDHDPVDGISTSTELIKPTLAFFVVLSALAYCRKVPFFAGYLLAAAAGGLVVWNWTTWFNVTDGQAILIVVVAAVVATFLLGFILSGGAPWDLATKPQVTEDDDNPRESWRRRLANFLDPSDDDDQTANTNAGDDDEDEDDEPPARRPRPQPRPGGGPRPTPQGGTQPPRGGRSRGQHFAADPQPAPDPDPGFTPRDPSQARPMPPVDPTDPPTARPDPATRTAPGPDQAGRGGVRAWKPVTPPAGEPRLPGPDPSDPRGDWWTDLDDTSAQPTASVPAEGNLWGPPPEETRHGSGSPQPAPGVRPRLPQAPPPTSGPAAPDASGMSSALRRHRYSGGPDTRPPAAATVPLPTAEPPARSPRIVDVDPTLSGGGDATQVHPGYADDNYDVDDEWDQEPDAPSQPSASRPAQRARRAAASQPRARRAQGGWGRTY